jgi:hypothetical protein
MGRIRHKDERATEEKAPDRTPEQRERTPEERRTIEERTTTTRRVTPMARGGVSFASIITGMVVAFGTVFVLGSIVGSILVGTGAWPAELGRQEAIGAGIAAGVAFVLIQFLAYLWGGYTAGRMARGAGTANGLLVPVAGIVVAAVVGAIGAVLNARADLLAPITPATIPLEQTMMVNFGAGIGLAALIAMFLGGFLGGRRGAAWHETLEVHTYETEESPTLRQTTERS